MAYIPPGVQFRRVTYTGDGAVTRLIRVGVRAAVVSKSFPAGATLDVWFWDDSTVQWNPQIGQVASTGGPFRIGSSIDVGQLDTDIGFWNAIGVAYSLICVG